MMYDVIVIGARCGGAPTAMLLARAGHQVLLVDRATFPSELPQGHFIHRHGPRRLQRWGLLDRIAATGCPAVTSMTYGLGDMVLAGADLQVDGVALGYGPRRAALDAILVEAAVEAGVELREGFVVEEIAAEDGRGAGIRGRSRQGGALVTEHATVTVGADGRNSRLARAVRAPQYEATAPVACWYFSYWADVLDRGLEFYGRDHTALFAFPTNDGLFAIFAGWPSAELPTVRSDIEGAFMTAVDRAPDLAGRVRSGRRAERFYGATDLPNFVRKPYGPGWALVGDAGCHKDPFLALGICDALRDAESLADALHVGLSGQCPLDAALAGYERQRNAATFSDYQQNLHLAQFKPLPPDTTRLIGAIQGNQEATNQYLMAREGMIPQEAFFNPENLRRLTAATAVGSA